MGCVSSLAQSAKNNKFALYLQYLKENGKNEVVFLLANNRQRFLQIDTTTVGMVRDAQSTQNNKFAIFLQYLKKKMGEEVDLIAYI